MHDQIFKALDRYSLRARLMPALMTILPATLAVAAWFPEKLAVLAGLLGFVAVFGSVCFLGECVRDRGKVLEPILIEGWGGLPTTLMLRHRDTHLNPETKKRYHRRLADLLPDQAMPTADEEADDPEHADTVYASCGDFLREQTRDAKFDLLLSENIQYGTRRNLLGVKPIALWIVFPSLLSCAAATGYAVRTNGSIEVGLFAFITVLLCLTFWLLRVNRCWVKTIAFTYAARLLASCDSFKPTTKA